jgi:hypothetical protein
MIDHTGIGVADVGHSAAFYDEALGALGLRRVMQMPEGVGTDGIGYGVNDPVFWIDRYHPHSVKQPSISTFCGISNASTRTSAQLHIPH